MTLEIKDFASEIKQGIPDKLPEMRPLDHIVDHAPRRPMSLDKDSFRLAIENALRYFPHEWHGILGAEFAEELRSYGHIYMHRFRPRYGMKARPLKD